jgi:uncharacterized iron-regulated membrane protein
LIGKGGRGRHDFNLRSEYIMSSAIGSSHRTPGNVASQAAYRTLWRWHFYAGLFVMPFLLVLAITGTLYCFQPQLEPLLYPHRMVVEPAVTPRLGEDALLARARAAMPAGSMVTTASINADPTRSAAFVFRSVDGEKQSIYLNPYTGEVLGTLSVEHRFMQVDRMIHRKLLLGKPGELIMELAACWTLVMIGTGVALWWPREALPVRAMLVPRLKLRGRPFWKNLHAVMGIWLAAGALAFVLTGLPWSGSWGKQFKALATRANLGSPAGAWGSSNLRSTIPDRSNNAAVVTTARAMSGDGDAMPGMIMDDLPLQKTPWAVGDSTVPQSRGGALLRSWPSVLSLEGVVAIARSRGLTDGYDVALPASPTGVYTVSSFPADPRQERTLHIDQYSGAILKDIGYRDYGAVSKAVSYGTSLHMGRYFGLANQVLCAVISLGLAGMTVTGCAMWWKRRPQRSLGAPPRERNAPPMRGWISGLVVLGIVFPLMGATMLVVWLADRVVFGRAMRRVAS